MFKRVNCKLQNNTFWVVIRRARGHSFLGWSYGLGHGGLRWIWRRGGSWPLLMRNWGVSMASSDHAMVKMEREVSFVSSKGWSRVAWASQGGGEVSQGLDGNASWKQCWLPLNRSLTGDFWNFQGYWNSQGCWNSVSGLRNRFANPLNFRKVFARLYWVAKFLQSVRKVNWGLRNFRNLNLWLQNFCNLNLWLRNMLYFFFRSFPPPEEFL